MQSAMSSAERIFQLLDTPVTIESPKNALIPKPFRGEVVFDNVWFYYKPDDPVLKGVSFRIEPGEKVAVVGATGAGKTTTIKLLNRFYDIQRAPSKSAAWTCASGTCRRCASTSGLFCRMSFSFRGMCVPTWPSETPRFRWTELRRRPNSPTRIVLFNGCREPLTLSAGRGSNFSAGQRQLLSLARVLVFQPEILVMDEATSSVDTETELLIQDALDKVMKDRTCLVIAHRLSTIRNADRIIVLHHGEVREMGSHAELMERRGIYYRLYQLQYEREELKLATYDAAPKIHD